MIRMLIQKFMRPWRVRQLNKGIAALERSKAYHHNQYKKCKKMLQKSYAIQNKFKKGN